LEQSIMTRIRTKRQRAVAFEALEGRLALSAGMGIAVAPHHADAVVVRQIQKSIPASFKGHAQLINNGSELTTTGLKGTIGKDRFTGYGTGTVVGKQFTGGTVNLSNSKGTIKLSLGSAFVVKVGKSSKQEVSMVAVAASGKYASYVGISGTLTSWNVPAKPNGTASFSGTFNG
jgi:hypothetical protein